MRMRFAAAIAGELARSTTNRNRRASRWNTASWTTCWSACPPTRYSPNQCRRDATRLACGAPRPAPGSEPGECPAHPAFAASQSNARPAIDFTPSFAWQSKVFFDDDNDIPALQVTNLVPDLVQDEVQGSYATVDARLGLEMANGRWRIGRVGSRNHRIAMQITPSGRLT